MERLEAVKILHDIKNRMVYNLYADYFRFLGIYVGEGIISEYAPEEKEKDSNCFQAFLCITEEEERISKTILKDEKFWIYINPVAYGAITLNNYGTTKTQQLMESVLERLKNQLEKNFVTFPETLFQHMVKIFCESKVLKGSYLLQYYRMKAKIHEETEAICRKALIALEESKAEFTNDKVFEYARLFCKQKINFSRFLQFDKTLAYPIESLLEECQQLLLKYTNFSNAWVLTGMICEVSHNDVGRAISAYKKALDKVGMHCYASHIYYWIGNLYEQYGEYKDADFAYSQAYDYKKKYRNIHKMAKAAEREGDFERALSYYKEVLTRLKTRKDLRMDPLEQEYYYKTGVLACFLCVVYLKKYDQAIEYGHEMLDFYNNYLMKRKDFAYFFGEDAEMYSELSKSRIKLKKVYECLAMAYRECGDLQKSEEFWGKSEE